MHPLQSLTKTSAELVERALRVYLEAPWCVSGSDIEDELATTELLNRCEQAKKPERCA